MRQGKARLSCGFTTNETNFSSSPDSMRPRTSGSIHWNLYEVRVYSPGTARSILMTWSRYSLRRQLLKTAIVLMFPLGREGYWSLLRNWSE